MHKVVAMVRQDIMTRASYRFQMLTSFGALMAGLIPLYFVAEALDPMMKSSIGEQGGHYFTFVLVGMIVMRLCYAIVTSLPATFGSAIRNGTLEAMFATPTPLAVIVIGMVGFSVIWTTAEAAVLLLGGLLLGAQISLLHFLPGLLIVALIILTYLAFAILGVALILAFRTTGPVLTGILLATNLLGGIYYPTHVIPSWIQNISLVLPMTYGLRALRQVTLEGASLPAVTPDLMVLAAFLVVLLPASWGLLLLALRHARKAGTLAHY